MAYTGVSIVDFLKDQGQASDYASRSRLATQYGIQGYQGTAAQNTQLLGFLRQPAPAPAPTIQDPARIDPAQMGIGNQDPNRPGAAQLPTSVSSTAAVPKTPGPGAAPVSGEVLPAGTADDTLDFSGQVENILKSYGVQKADANTNPVTAFADTYNQIIGRLGLGDIKTQYESLTKDWTDLQDKLNDEIAQNNENPWLTEGMRQERNRALAQKYEGRLNNLTSRQQLLQSLYEHGHQQAQFIAQQGLGQERANQNLVFQALDLASRQADARRTILNTQRDDARGNLQILANQASAGALNWDALSESQKNQVYELEQRAGFPTGFIESLKNKNPKADILSITTRQAQNGDEFADVLMRDPDTGALRVENKYLGGARTAVTRGAGGGSSRTVAKPALEQPDFKFSNEEKNEASALGIDQWSDQAKNVLLNGGLTSKQRREFIAYWKAEQERLFMDIDPMSLIEKWAAQLDSSLQ